MEVDGDVTTLDLSSLISQTEYDVAVTPFYDEGPAAPMMGTAITGLRRVSLSFPQLFFYSFLSHTFRHQMYLLHLGLRSPSWRF